MPPARAAGARAAPGAAAPPRRGRPPRWRPHRAMLSSLLSSLILSLSVRTRRARSRYLRRRDIPAGAKRLRERRGLAVSDDEADLAHGQLLLGEQLGSRASRRTA